MIPRTRPQGTDWKQSLRNAITQPEALLEAVKLPKSEWLAGARVASQSFPLRVPISYVERIERGNAHDPLLRQILPLAVENNPDQASSQDPVGDLSANCIPGLIHKYQSRALLITTGACAIHCRYCFRRHFPYSDSHSGGSNISGILDYLDKHTELNEVILSGGDPLMLDDDALAVLLSNLATRTHIRWIRFHTRLPVVLPERIDTGLLETIRPYTDKLIIVIHSNHPNEIDRNIGSVLFSLRDAGIRLFNQSVLLKGVNDNTPALCQLSHTLFEHSVQPYYLHLLDRVQGARHFEVTHEDALTIYQQLQSRLPGYLVPRLVREESGMPHKTII